MASNLYRQTIPGFIKSLRNLSNLLEKAIKFSEEKSLKPEEILDFKLFEAGQGEMPVFEDNEKTFEQLLERVRLTIEALEKVHPNSMAGREDEELFVDSQRNGRYIFDTSQRYVSEYAIPHFHFHLTSIYCALRRLGVPVEFMDYFAGVFVPAA